MNKEVQINQINSTYIKNSGKKSQRNVTTSYNNEKYGKIKKKRNKGLKSKITITPIKYFFLNMYTNKQTNKYKNYTSQVT